MIVRFFIGLMGCFLCFVPLVEAHDFSRSHSFWTVEGNRLKGSFVVKQREVTRVPVRPGYDLSLEEHFLYYIQERVSAANDELACQQPRAAQLTAAAKGYFKATFEFICADEKAIALSISAFHDLMERHVHVAQVKLEHSGEKIQLLFGKDSQRQVIPFNSGQIVHADSVAEQSAWALLKSYVLLGAQHVLSGADHLAFLLILLFIAGTPLRMLTIILGFTIGHSLSLSLAYLKLVHYSSSAVEALIGFTLILATMEFVGRKTDRLTEIGLTGAALLILYGLISLFVASAVLPTVAFFGLALFTFCYLSAQVGATGYIGTLLVTTLFGFIHGFGFAGILKEMTLSGREAILPLIGFNLGVEVGQLIFVAVVLCAGFLFSFGRLASVKKFAPYAVIPMIAGLGVFWFTQRLWM